MSAPIRDRIEPGIYERVNADGERLGLEIQFKDSSGVPRRRTVQGNIHAARDALAEARSKRVRREPEAAESTDDARGGDRALRGRARRVATQDYRGLRLGVREDPAGARIASG